MKYDQRRSTTSTYAIAARQTRRKFLANTATRSRSTGSQRGTYAVSQKGKREKRLPITLLIETAISNVGECVRLEYRHKETIVKRVKKTAEGAR